MNAVSIPDDLKTFLAEKRDVREYRRGLAVKLVIQGYTYSEISTILDVSLAFISHSKKQYVIHGIEGLTLKYKGTQPFLSKNEYESIIYWINNNAIVSLEDVRNYIKDIYQIEFQSPQSYYTIIKKAHCENKKIGLSG